MTAPFKAAMSLEGLELDAWSRGGSAQACTRSKAGDVLDVPAGGQDHAHQLINTRNGPLVYLGISTTGRISSHNEGTRSTNRVAMK